MPIKDIIKKIKSVDVSKIKTNIKKISQHKRFPFFLKTGLFSALILIFIYFGMTYILQDKAEKAFIESFKDYDIGYTTFEVKPFLRRAYITDFRIKGFAGNRKNYFFSKEINLKNLGTSKGKINRFTMEAKNINIYVMGWVGKDQERPSQFEKLSFKFKDNGRKKQISNFSFFNKHGKSILSIDKSGLKNIKKNKRGDITSANFYFSGDLGKESLSILGKIRSKKENKIKNNDEDLPIKKSLNIESDALYAYDPKSGIHQLRNLTGNIPAINLNFGFKNFSWAKDKINKPPYFFKQKLSDFNVKLPVDVLASILSKGQNANNEKLINYLTLIKADKINANYSSNYTYNEENENADFSFYIDIKNQLKISMSLNLTDINFGLMKSNKVQFLNISKLAGIEISIENNGYFNRSSEYKMKQGNITSDRQLIEKELGIFDIFIAKYPKIKFLKRVKSALRDFLTNKNSFVFKLKPRNPISIAEVVEMLMMAPDQTLKTLDATIKGS